MWEKYFTSPLLSLLKKFVPGFDEIPPETVGQMVEYWFYDVAVNAITHDNWEKIIDSLHEMEGEVADFAAKVLDSYQTFLEMMDKQGLLEKMVLEFAARISRGGKDRGKRRDDRLYRWFVEAVRDDLLLSVPLLCHLGGEMSGDMFGIGATMLVNTDLRVLVGHTDSVLDHTSEIKDFLERCDPERVEVVPKPTFLEASISVMQRTKIVQWVTSYNVGTMYLGFEGFWSDTWVRERIRTCWGVSDDGGFRKMCPGIAQWLQNYGLPIREMVNAQVLVLWSRFTGKKGEIHVEHDTSFTGTRQLVQLAADMGYYVIIAGDKPVVHLGVKDPMRRASKFDTICQEVNEEIGEVRAFNLTGFWQDPTWKMLAKARSDQFRVYELLHRICDVRHLGMRSGNLEALALMGFCVRYMEEEGSWGGDRMSAWNGIGLGYERIIIKAPPTRTGKFVVAKYKDPPKMLGWIVARNAGVPGTVGDPSKVKVKELSEFALQKLKIKEEKKKRRTQNLSSKRQDSGLEVVMEQVVEPSTPVIRGQRKPEEIEHTHIHRGFILEDLQQVAKYLRSPNTTMRLDKCPLHWASKLL